MAIRFQELCGNWDVIDLFFVNEFFGYFHNGECIKLGLNQEVRKEILDYFHRFRKIAGENIKNASWFEEAFEKGNFWNFFIAVDEFFRKCIKSYIEYYVKYYIEFEEICNGVLEVLGNVFNSLFSIEEFILIPATPMLNFPFHLIKDEKKFLFEKSRITYLPHVEFIKMLEGKYIEGDEKIAIYSAKCSVKGCPNYPLEELFWVEKEAENVSKILGGKKIRSPHVNSLIKEYGGKLKVLHIAAHCYADLRKVHTSRICLENEHMHPEDFLKLRPKGLVFLSACETGVYESGKMDALGFHTAILASGAKVIISTLWELNDSSAIEFALEFYSDCKDRPSYKSYRKAMKKIWNNYKSILMIPYCWYGLPLDY